MLNLKIKLSFIGALNSGKSALLQSWACGVFPGAYYPTTSRILQTTCNLTTARETLHIELNTFEIGGGQQNDHGLAPFLKNSDVLVVCFSLVDRDSFMEIDTRWLQFLEHARKIKVPCLLVGCKKDLRPRTIRLDGSGPPGIADAEGEKMARAVGIDPTEGYFECSALTYKGVDEVFERAIEVAIAHKLR